MRTMSTSLAVHGRRALSDVQQRTVEALERRAEPLRAYPERGAQAAEYAMVGGIGAAACGGVAYLLKEHPDLLEGLLTTTLDTVGSWFSNIFS